MGRMQNRLHLLEILSFCTVSMQNGGAVVAHSPTIIGAKRSNIQITKGRFTMTRQTAYGELIFPLNTLFFYIDPTKEDGAKPL